MKRSPFSLLAFRRACALLAIAGLSLAPISTALPQAKQPQSKEDSGKAAPPAPVAPAPVPAPTAAAERGIPEELKNALNEASKRLKTLQAQSEKDRRDSQAKVATTSKEILELRASEKKLRERLDAMALELRTVTTRARAAVEARESAQKQVDEVNHEISSQAASLNERLTGTLVTAQDEQLRDMAGKLWKQKSTSLGEMTESLFEIYERVLGYARSCAMFQIPVRVEQADDRVESVKVLRFGLLGGYFNRTGANGTGAGYVLPDPVSRSGFVADSAGLTANQQSAIAACMREPKKGGALPLDVSGGAALAQAGITLTPRDWFRRGGFWMWPVAAAAAIAVLLVLETVFTLTRRRFLLRGIEKKIGTWRRTGQVPSDSVIAENCRGLPGQVVEAALRSQDQVPHAMETAVEEALLRNEQSLEGRITLLSILVGAAPLLGFLGTTGGLVALFRLLSLEGFTQPNLLSNGIAEALIPTQAGLYVGGACLLVRGLLGLLVDQTLVRIQRSALSLMSLLLREQGKRLEIGGLV